MSMARRLLATVALVVIVIAGAMVAGVVAKDAGDSAAVGRNEIAADGTVQGRLYPGDPATEAPLVAAEQKRLDFVTTVTGSAPWRLDMEGPYRIPTVPATTLVLTARAEPYTIDDLERLAPDTFVAQSDGSFLLSESIVALPGSTLALGGAAPVTVALASSAEAFVSIVTMGASVTLVGAPDGPVTFVSRDPGTGGPDTTTADGRAYIRIIGGTVDFQHAGFSDLGFWSGHTGGLALTGVGDGTAPGQDPPVAAETEDHGAPTLSAQDVTALMAEEQPEPGYVTGSLSDVSATGNAFGIFLSRATGMTLSGSRVTGSLIDGIVLHRGVTATTIESTETTDNAVDGIAIEPSSADLVLSAVTSSGNGRNGISIDGRPLADGPSATGTPPGAFGDIRLTDSHISNNTRYGVEVGGSDGVAVTGCTISGHEVGVVLTHAATGVEIAGNTMEGQQRHAIAVRAGVADSTIHDNQISSVDTGVHVRDASVTVEDNSFAAISRHAVTLTGTASDTRVERNTIAGLGTTAIHDDAAGGYVADNNTDGWEEPITARSVLNALTQPLTLVWVTLGLLVLLTALSGRRLFASGTPYEERIPLTQLSRGIMSADEIRGRNHERTHSE